MECNGTIQSQHNTKDFYQELKGIGRTTLEVNSRSVTQVHIKSGIDQGDALSWLLFCIGLNPITQIITKSEYGYTFKSGANISQLLYVDDIKLYTKNDRDIYLQIHLTMIYSEDIGKSFGLEKCGQMTAK